MTSDQRAAYMAQWWGDYSTFVMTLYASAQMCTGNHRAIITAWDEFARTINDRTKSPKTTSR